jgi:hypothetical protein
MGCSFFLFGDTLMKIIDYDPDLDELTVTEVQAISLAMITLLVVIDIFYGELEWIFFSVGF